MRLFFALPIEPDSALDILNWRDKMLMPQDNWVPVANYHITLAFIGEIEPKKLDQLLERCDSVLENTGPIRMEPLVIDQLGYFARPSILWLGPRTWPDSLSMLNKTLGSIALEFGAKKDRKPYQPHITLARKCLPPSNSAVSPKITLTNDGFGLYESVQGKSGVSYRQVAYWTIA